VAVAGVQDRPDVTGADAPEADVDEGPDDAAHHLVTERGRRDLEAQHPSAPTRLTPTLALVDELTGLWCSALDDAPARRQHAPHQGAFRLAGSNLHPTAERGEVVLADQRG